MTATTNISTGQVATSAKGLRLPAIRDIDSYIQATHRFPMLLPDEERELGRRLREENDLEAASRLVTSHLRYVVARARNYLGYGLPHADLIQEGNIGLMKAVKHFDERLGNKLVTYASHWVDAEIREYVLKNSRMVKVASTKSQRKLFFNLRRHKHEALALSHSQVQSLAKDLDVTESEVIEMDKRMSGSDIPLYNADDDDDRMAPVNYLQTTETEPTAVLERDGKYRLYSDGIQEALRGLDPRSRRVIESRWMDDENSMTLQHLATEFGVSAERIRQIETAALKKMRKTLTAYT